MKEFKFWALPYSITQLILFSLPTAIIFLFLLFYVDFFKYLEYFVAGVIVWNIFCLFFMVKRVKISFSPTDTISIYTNGIERLVAEPYMLEYVKGGDINNTKSQTTISLSFGGKEFSYSIFEWNTSKSNTQVELLRYMIATYNLEPEYTKNTFVNKVYLYRNPDFKGLSITQYNKSEK